MRGTPLVVPLAHERWFLMADKVILDAELVLNIKDADGKIKQLAEAIKNALKPDTKPLIDKLSKLKVPTILVPVEPDPNSLKNFPKNITSPPSSNNGGGNGGSGGSGGGGDNPPNNTWRTRLQNALSTSDIRIDTVSRKIADKNLQAYKKAYQYAWEAVDNISDDSSDDYIRDARIAVENVKLFQRELEKLQNSGQQLKPFDTLIKQLDTLRQKQTIPENIRRSLDELYDTSKGTSDEDKPFASAKLQNEISSALSRIQRDADAKLKSARKQLADYRQAISEGAFGDRKSDAQRYTKNLDSALRRLNMDNPDFTTINKWLDSLKALESKIDTIEAKTSRSKLSKQLNDSLLQSKTGNGLLTGENLNAYKKQQELVAKQVEALDVNSSKGKIEAAQIAVKDLLALQKELQATQSSGGQISSFSDLIVGLDKLRNMEGVPSDVKRSLDGLYESFQHLADTPLNAAKLQKEMTSAFSRIQKSAETQVKSASNALDSFKKRFDSGFFKDSTDEARTTIDALGKAIADFKIDDPDLSGINQYIGRLKELEEAQVRANDAQKLASDKSKFAGQIRDWQYGNKKAAALFRTEIDDILSKLQEADSVEFDNLQQKLRDTTELAEQLGVTGGNFFQRLKGSFDFFSPITLISRGIDSITDMFTDGARELKTVDTYLTEISKVSERSSASLRALGAASFEAASSFGAQTETYLKGVQEWSRSGYDAQAEELGKVTVMAQAAGDMTSEMASSYLIATNAAYKLQGDAEKLTHVLDGQNQITNRNAVSMEELAAATRIAGAQAASAGIDIDKFSAAVGTIQAVTQQGGEVAGRAFKAVLMNLQQVTGDVGDGEIIDVEQLNKVEAALAAVGIATSETVNGLRQLRDPMVILEELANKFNELEANSVQRANIISALGGKQRGAQLTALLTNWDLYKKMLADFNDNAEGSAAREAEKTANSWEGAINRVRNSFAKLLYDLTDSSMITGSLDTLSGIIGLIDKLAMGIKKINPAGIIALIAAFFKFNGTLSVIKGAFGLLRQSAKSAFNTMRDNSPARTIDGLIAKIRVLAKNVFSLGKDYKEATKIVAEQNKTAGRMMAAIGSVGTTLASVAIGMLINWGFNKLDEWIHRAEQVAEDAKRINDDYTSNKASISEKQQNVDSIKGELTELAKGVNSQGENISLTNDEYARYLSLSGQIADMFPQLVSGYTSQGDAIIAAAGNAEEFNKKLKEQLELEKQINEGKLLEGWDTNYEHARNVYAETLDKNFDTAQYRDMSHISLDKVKTIWEAVQELVLDDNSLTDIKERGQSFVIGEKQAFVDAVMESLTAHGNASGITALDIQDLLADYVKIGFANTSVDFDKILSDAPNKVREINLGLAELDRTFAYLRESLSIKLRDGMGFESFDSGYQSLGVSIAQHVDPEVLMQEDFNPDAYITGLISDLNKLSATGENIPDMFEDINAAFNDNAKIGDYRVKLAKVMELLKTAAGEDGFETPGFEEALYGRFDIPYTQEELDNHKVLFEAGIQESDQAKLTSWLDSLTVQEYEIAISLIPQYEGNPTTMEAFSQNIAKELEQQKADYKFDSSAYSQNIAAAKKTGDELSGIYKSYLNGEDISDAAVELVNQYPTYKDIFEHIDASGHGTEGLGKYLRDSISQAYGPVASEISQIISEMSEDNPTKGAAINFHNYVVSLMEGAKSAQVEITSFADQYKSASDTIIAAYNELENNGKLKSETLKNLYDLTQKYGFRLGDYMGDDGEFQQIELESLFRDMQSSLQDRIDRARETKDTSALSELMAAQALLDSLTEKTGNLAEAASRVNFQSFTDSAENADKALTNLQNAQELRTARGEELNAADYTDLIKATQGQISAQEALLGAYRAAQSGVDEGSAEWESYQSSIDSCTDSIHSARVSLYELDGQLLRTAGAAGSLSKLTSLGDALKAAFGQQLVGSIDIPTTAELMTQLRTMGVNPGDFIQPNAIGEMQVDRKGIREVAIAYIENAQNELRRQLAIAENEQQRTDIELELQLYAAQRATIEAATSEYTLMAGGLEAITQQSELAAQAMQQLSAGESSAAATLAQLIAQNSGYADALEVTGSAIRLNEDRVNELKKAQLDMLRGQLDKNLDDATSKYKEQAREIHELMKGSTSLEDALKGLDDTSSQHLISLIRENDGLRALIGQYGALASSLDEATVAYQEWLGRDSLPSPDDMYYEGQDAYEAYQEGLESGKTGKGTEHAAAEKFMFSGGEATELGEKYAKRYFKKGDGDDAIEQERRNLQKFQDDLTEWGYLYKDEFGDYSLAKSISFDELEEKTGLSRAMITALFKDLESFDTEIDWSPLLPDDQELNNIDQQLDAVVANAEAKIKELEKLRDSNPGEFGENEQEELERLQHIVDSYNADDLIGSMNESLSGAEPVKLPFEFDLTDLGEKLQAISSAVAEYFNGDSSPKGDSSSAPNKSSPASNQSMEVDTSDGVTNVERLTAAIETAINCVHSLSGMRIGDLGAYEARSSLLNVIDTLYRIINTRIPDKSFTTTNYQVVVPAAVGIARAQGSKRPEPGNEISLTGELGPELVVRNGRYFYTGLNGAEFMRTQPGDIIFSAEDTKRIERGLPGARGKAYAGGTGSAYAVGGSLGLLITPIVAGAVMGVLKKKKKDIDGYKGSELDGGKNKGSGGKKKGSKGKGGSSGGGSGGSKAVDDLFDWIEVRLDRLEARTQELIHNAEDAIGSIARNKELDEALKNTQAQIDAASKGYDRYMKQANDSAKKSKLSSSMIEKVQNGEIDIEKLSGSTRENVEEYKKWYDKAQDMKELLHELKEQQTELATQKLDNIINDYERLNDVLATQIDDTKALMELDVSRGEIRDESAYQQMIEAETKRGENMQAASNALSKELEASVAAGHIKEGSEEWVNYQKQIAEFNSAVIESQQSVQDLKDELNALRIANLEEVVNELQDVRDAQEDAVSLKDATGKRVDESDFLGQANSMRDEARAHRNVINEIRRQMSEVKKGSEKYAELRGQLADAESALRDLETAQAELNRRIAEMPLERLQDELDILERQSDAQQSMMDFHEAQGEKLTDKEYIGLIAEGDKQLENLQKQRSEIAKLLAGTERGSELWKEYSKQLDDVDSAILDIKTNQEEWNDSLIDLEIDKLKEQRDLLEEQNDKYEKRLALEKAMQELERAKTQRNKLVYREGQGFVYEADQKAIMDAQEELDDQRHQEMLDKIDEAIDALEDSKRVDNLYDYFANRIPGKVPGANLPDAALQQSVARAVTSVVADTLRNDIATQQAQMRSMLDSLRMQQVSAGIGTISISAINLYGVQDVDGLAQGIANELPILLSQKLYSTR